MASSKPIPVLTRRAILTGITATVGVGFAAPATATLSDDPEHVLAAWRGLVACQVEYEKLADEMSQIEDNLPPARVLVLKDKQSDRACWASTIEEIDRHFPEPHFPISATARAARDARRDALAAEFEALKARAAAERERAGWAWRDRRQEEIDVAESPLHKAIDEAVGDHPIIIAAKLWQGLTFERDKFFDDYPARCIVGAISGLLPHLPADMRAAAELVTRSGRTDTMHDVWRRMAAAGRTVS